MSDMDGQVCTRRAGEGRAGCLPTTAATGKTRRTDDSGAAPAAPTLSPALIPSSIGAPPCTRTPLADRAPTARTAVAALVAAAACWGTGTVASKQVVDDVAPLTLLPMQLAASCVLLLVVDPGPPRAVRLDTAGPPARRPRRPQPGHRLRARADRPDHHHRQHVRAALGARTGRHHAARRARPPRAHPAPARGRGRRGHHRGAAGGVPARRHRRRRRHHPHRRLDRVLRPVLGADPTAAAGRLLADRGARPAGSPPWSSRSSWRRSSTSPAARAGT